MQERSQVNLSIDTVQGSSHLITLHEILITSYYYLSIEYMMQRKVVEAEAQLQQAKELAKEKLAPSHYLYQQLFPGRPIKSAERKGVMRPLGLWMKHHHSRQKEVIQTSRSPSNIYGVSSFFKFPPPPRTPKSITSTLPLLGNDASLSITPKSPTRSTATSKSGVTKFLFDDQSIAEARKPIKTSKFKNIGQMSHSKLIGQTKNESSLYKTAVSQRSNSKPRPRTSGNSKKDLYGFNHTIGEKELKKELQQFNLRTTQRQKNIEKKFQKYYRVYEVTPYRRNQPTKQNKLKEPLAQWKKLKRKLSHNTFSNRGEHSTNKTVKPINTEISEKEQIQEAARKECHSQGRQQSVRQKIAAKQGLRYVKLKREGVGSVNRSPRASKLLTFRQHQIDKTMVNTTMPNIFSEKFVDTNSSARRTPLSQENKKQEKVQTPSRNDRQLSSFSTLHQQTLEKVKRKSPKVGGAEQLRTQESSKRSSSPKEKISDNLKRINSEINKFQSKLKEYNKQVQVLRNEAMVSSSSRRSTPYEMYGSDSLKQKSFTMTTRRASSKLQQVDDDLRTIAFEDLDSFSQDNNTMRGLRSSTQMSGLIASRMKTDSPGGIEIY